MKLKFVLKHFALLLFSFYFLPNSSGQSFAVQYSEVGSGETFGIASLAYATMLSKCDENGVYYVEMLNDRLQPISKTEYFCQKKDLRGGISSSYHFLQSVFMKDRLLVFFTKADSTQDIVRLYCQKIAANGMLEGDIQRIDETYVNSNMGSVPFLISVNQDRSMFLVQKSPKQQNADISIWLKLFDCDLTNKSVSSISLPYKIEQAKHVKSLLTNKGDIYVLVGVNPDKKDNYYSFCFVNASSDFSLTEHLVDLKAKDIRSIDIALCDKSNTAICAGIYTDSVNGKLGSFYVKLNTSTQEEIVDCIKLLPEASLKNIEPQTIANFALKDIKINEDSSSFMFAKDKSRLLIYNLDKHGNVANVSLLDCKSQLTCSSNFATQSDIFPFIWLENDVYKGLLFTEDNPLTKRSLISCQLLPNNELKRTILIDNFDAKLSFLHQGALKSGDFILPMDNKNSKANLFRFSVK